MTFSSSPLLHAPTERRMVAGVSLHIVSTRATAAAAAVVCQGSQSEVKSLLIKKK